MQEQGGERSDAFNGMALIESILSLSVHPFSVSVSVFSCQSGHGIKWPINPPAGPNNNKLFNLHSRRNSTAEAATILPFGSFERRIQ